MYAKIDLRRMMNRKVYIAVTAALASMLLWSCGESDNKTAKKNVTQNVTEASDRRENRKCN